MKCLRKELYEQNGKARILRFFNVKSNKTVNYKVYDSQRKLIVITDDVEYARKVLKDKANNIVGQRNG